MLRSLFFAPANRAELVLKFPRFGADCSVIDLEDATPPLFKVQARESLQALVAELRQRWTVGHLAIRVNAYDTPWFEDDVAVALQCPVDFIVLPKLERVEQLAPFAAAQAGPANAPHIIGGIESVQGVLNAVALCQAGSPLAGVFFGAEDYVSDLGGQRTKEGTEVLYARSLVAMAAKAAGISAIDQAVVDIRDDEGFAQDSTQGRRLGYQGKICLTPRQVELAHTLHGASPEEVRWAEQIITHYRQAMQAGRGVIELHGQMIDTPLLRRAEQIVQRHASGLHEVAQKV